MAPMMNPDTNYEPDVSDRWLVETPGDPTPFSYWFNDEFKAREFFDSRIAHSEHGDSWHGATLFKVRVEKIAWK